MVEERDLPRPLLRHRLAGAIRHERVATIVGHGRGTRPAATASQRAVVAGLVPRPCPTGLRARSLCDAFSTKPETRDSHLFIEGAANDQSSCPEGAKVCRQGREPLGTVHANRQAQRATDSAIGLHPHSQTSARRAPLWQVSYLDRALRVCEPGRCAMRSRQNPTDKTRDDKTRDSHLFIDKTRDKTRDSHLFIEGTANDQSSCPEGAKVCRQGREPLGTVRANRQAQRATDSAIGLHPHSQTSARRAPSRQVSCLDRALPYSGGATTASLSTTRADHGLPRGRCALL